MKQRPTKLPEEGGGIVGFGCGAILGVAVWLIWYLGSDTPSWWPLVLAVIFGLFGAKFGDRFFAWVLAKASWWV